jgi:CDP-diacylglycerol--glycerol-3-phosphate 3-phosphatidyltransferase
MFFAGKSLYLFKFASSSGFIKIMKFKELFKDKVVTVSNFITMVRIFLAPYVFYLIYMHSHTGESYYLYIEIIAFMIITLSDFLDGFLARLLKQESDLGQFLDPTADKITGSIIGLALVLFKGFPLWFFLIAVVREIFIVYFSAHLFYKKDVGVRPNIFGKICVGLMVLSFIFYALSMDYTFYGYQIKELILYMVLLFYVLGSILSIKTYSRYYIGRKK